MSLRIRDGHGPHGHLVSFRYLTSRLDLEMPAAGRDPLADGLRGETRLGSRTVLIIC
jgi:hypothetical protein